MAVTGVQPGSGSNPSEFDNRMLFEGHILAATPPATEEETRPPEADETAPPLNEYTEIEEPGKTSPDTVRFQKEGSDTWVVVSKEAHPALYEQVVADHKALAAVRQSEEEGYELAGADVEPPQFQDYKDIGPADELAEGTIRYEVREEDGSIKKVVVARSLNPELFEAVAGHSKVLAEVQKWERVHYSLAGPDATAPALEDYIPESINVDTENGIVTYITDDDDQVIVVRDVNPQMYEDVIAAKAVHDGLDAGGDGYERPPADLTQVDIAQVGPPGEFGEGVIRFSTKDGKKYIVNKITDPALYAQAVANYESTKIDEVNRIREKYGMPALSELDVMSMSTGVKSDPDKDDSSILNVGEYAVTKLLEDYREGVKSGKYAKDSVQAKLVRAFEAKAALSAGYDIIPYSEQVNGGGSTSRDFGDGTVHLTDEDMHDIIDANSVDKAINTLLSDESIRKDYDAKLAEAVEKVPEADRTALTNKLVATLEGADYVKYLAELDKLGLSHMGSRDTSTLLTSLALLDPAKGEAAAQKLMMNTLTYELNNLDPSQITDENKDTALKDILFFFGNLIKTGGNAIRTAIGSWEKFIGELAGDKTRLTALRKTLEDAFPNGYGGQTYDEVMSRISGSIDKFIPSAERPEMYQFLSKMASTGFLGSMAGSISLLGSIYQLAGKGGALAETPMQRLAIANGFIGFLSMGSHFATLGDKVLNNIGVTGLADVMGLSKSLPEVWGAKGLYNFETKSPFKGNEALHAELSTKANEAISSIKLNYDPGDMYEGVSDLFQEEAKKQGIDLTQMPETVKKVAASALKVTGAVTDFVGGVIDIVLGAMTINSAIKSGDALGKTAGALQVISGTMGLGAGAIGVAALMGNIGAVSAAMGPLFFIGAVIGIVGAIIGMFVEHNKMQAKTDQQGQWFIDAAGDGLLYSDWGDKVEYARYATKVYENRDAPEDQSIYDFQKAEWEHFRNTPGKHGSSINRLDNKLHIDFDGGKQGQGKPKDEPAWRTMRF